MRHDAERRLTHALLDSSPLPAHWDPVLTHLRASPFTRLTRDDILAEAAGLQLLAPSPEVVDACFADFLAALGPRPDGFVATLPLEAVVPSEIAAGTWVFLPHRNDGWEEVEAASTRLHRDLVRENTGRDRKSAFVVIEYGINLWLWAEPPASGGDPVCHAGELISWESAWALDDSAGVRSASRVSAEASACGRSRSGCPRPPIFFGLPPVLRRRRMAG